MMSTNRLTYFSIAVILSVVPTAAVIADDTDLYLGQVSNGPTVRPKVLIILDNSGSMTSEVPSTKPAYDPSTVYANQGEVSRDRIYWSTDGRPPGTGTDHYLLANSNRCGASASVLSTTGIYTDYFAAWRPKNGTYRWRTVNDSDGTRESQYVECQADIGTQNAANPGAPAQADGYPLNTSSGPYTNAIASSNVDWDNMGVRSFYSANYMNWYHNASLAAPTKTRIEIAREVANNIIEGNPNIDFGLMIFNRNGDGQPNGGRIIRRIVENMSDAQRSALQTTVNDIRAETWTPLCETLYEAYRYFSGGLVYFGDDEPTLLPARDSAAERSGRYISPLGDCQQAYLILMTDGEPTKDTSADSLIDALPNMGSTSDSRLDELAGWMYRTDLDGNPSNGTQRVVTYTIGFATDQALLSATASKGGGRYYTALSAMELQDAFQGAVNEILSTDATFTAPSVAVNSFNRTRSLDDIYIAMFRPDSRPRWPGNLKKLRLDSTGTLVDADGVAAVDPVTGNIKETARSLWSAAPDGASVTSGGVGALLAARDPAARTIKTNSGTGGALESLAVTNTNLSNTDFGVAGETEKNRVITWARGVDVDDEDEDESTTDTRPWILGDPLHSRPLVINYGARSGYTRTNPDVRIVMGTNSGFLHMFKSGDGSEVWAFIPKELLPLLETLRVNASSTAHPYGVDGTATVHLIDANADGTISGEGDAAYLYFGLRRGGTAYYALNITDPDNPVFMWKIDDRSTGLSELGQSWSTPVATKIPGYDGLVLIFGGGYDPGKDADGIGGNDSVGRGVFIVDALNGALVWSATPAANSAKNLSVSALVDSIAAPVTVLDSNGDHLSDRIYAADTGGNLWRFDLPGLALPDETQEAWSAFKLASLGGDTAASDRRFFNKPDIVRTRYGSLAFDGIAIGSGNRESPLETAVTNRFYLVRDTQTRLASFSETFTPPTAITESDLIDVTANAVQDGTTAQANAVTTALQTAKGWYVTLEQSGEKALAASMTLSGTVFFTSFTPDASETRCVPVPGNGKLYAVNLQDAKAVFNWEVSSSPSSLVKADRSVLVGQRLPDAVTPHFGDDGIRIIGVGAGQDGSGSYATGSRLRTRGIYWYDGGTN